MGKQMRLLFLVYPLYRESITALKLLTFAKWSCAISRFGRTASNSQQPSIYSISHVYKDIKETNRTEVFIID